MTPTAATSPVHEREDKQLRFPIEVIPVPAPEKKPVLRVGRIWPFAGVGIALGIATTIKGSRLSDALLLGMVIAFSVIAIFVLWPKNSSNN